VNDQTTINYREYGVAFGSVYVDLERQSGFRPTGDDTTWFLPEELVIL